MAQLQVDNDDFLRRNPLRERYLNHIPHYAFSRGRMKWDRPKDIVHSLLRDNSVEATATKTLSVGSFRTSCDCACGEALHYLRSMQAVMISMVPRLLI